MASWNFFVMRWGDAPGHWKKKCSGTVASPAPNADLAIWAEPPALAHEK